MVDREDSTSWVEEGGAAPHLLRRVFLATSAGASFLALVCAWIGETTGLVLSLGVLVLSVLMFPLVRRGSIGLAGNLFAWALLATATFSIARANGIHDIAMLVFPVTLIVGAVLLGSTAYAILAAATLGATVGVGLAEVRGVLHTPYSALTDVDDVLIVAVILLVAAVMARQLVKAVRQSLHRAVSVERSYREIFDATDDAIFVHHPETGQVLDVNATALAMFRCGRAELLALSDGRLSATDQGFDSARAIAAIRQAATSGPHVVEWRSRRLDGTEFWTEVALRPVELRGELRVLALVRDVDDRRQLEERARQDDKLRSLGLLAGGVAHDFNNQLAAILSYADYLQASIPGDERLQEAVNGVLAAARRSSELTRQLLAFARRSEVRREPVDLHALLEELVRLLRRSVDKRIAVETHLDHPVARVLGDPSLLQNALLNLALNARDAMPEGGRILLATRGTTGSVERDGPHVPLVEVAVTDTGKGIPPDALSRIFEPFYTTKDRGTGMGLAAAYGTIQAHGGSIEVESIPGRGTTFTIRLPLHDSDPPRDPAGDAIGPELSGARVLVVDDEPLVLGATRRVLERAGCVVTAAEGGGEALARLESGEGFDVVVLDQVMPGLSGREVLAEMRRVSPELGVVLVSGYAEGGWGEGDAHAVRLTKPSEPVELLRAVRLLARRPGHGGAS